MSRGNPKPSHLLKLPINEDWLSVIIAMLIILLSVIGVLGKHGIMITF